MVLSMYRRFSESTKFLLKERWLRPVAMMLGHVKNRQPVLFHRHPGQAMLKVELQVLLRMLGVFSTPIQTVNDTITKHYLYQLVIMQKTS